MRTQQRHRQGHLIQAQIPPLGNCKDTGEEHFSLHNSKHTKHTHTTRVQNTTLYSDDTTHSKQHRSKGVNQMAPLERTITVALDMSKAFDTINIHTLIRKMLQSNNPDTIIMFIANYIKGRKAYTTYRNHTSSQRQFKTGVPQDGVLSSTLFNIYTADIPPPRTRGQVMDYADDITITSTHTSTNTAKKYIQLYLHKIVAWTKQNNPTLNPDKTICTLFTPDPAEYKSNLDPKQTTLHYAYIRTTWSPLDLWTDSAGVTALLARWTEKLAGEPQAGTSDSPHYQGSWEWVDNNNTLVMILKVIIQQ